MEYKQLSDDQKIKFIQILINILKSYFEIIAKIKNTNENNKEEM